MTATAPVIDRELLQTLRTELQAAMDAVLAKHAKHNLIASMGKITYSDTDFHCQLNVAVKPDVAGAPGVAFRPEWVKGCNKHGWSYGMADASSKLGKEFIHNGRVHVFLGINQTGHFAIGQEVAGKKGMFKIRPDQLKAARWL